MKFFALLKESFERDMQKLQAEPVLLNFFYFENYKQTSKSVVEWEKD